jgi:hydrogenase expression/formation protein HypD
MQYVDEFRDPHMAERLVEQIRKRASRRWILMEVCGGQTHSLLKYGIDEALADAVELIHGPGCPVCVTDAALLDHAIQLALQPQIVLASFGDMLRVPGTQLSLLQAQSIGAKVLPVYAPLDAVDYARQHPQNEIVFLAVGFETTAPSTALALLEAQRLQLNNFSILAAHVQVLPAMQWLMQNSATVQAFLAAGHVCTVTGYAHYRPFAAKYNVPVAVAGFEPLDLLHAVHACVHLLEDNTAHVVNCYSRSAAEYGNPAALQILNEVYSTCGRHWRGFGWIPDSGFEIRPRYATFDAARKFQLQPPPQHTPEPLLHVTEPSAQLCRAGDILAGRLKPHQCPHFGHNCTPDSPLGAPMVSSEGACAAWFRYHPQAITTIAKSPQIGGPP